MNAIDLAIKKAKEIDSYVLFEGGINWNWIIGFSSKKKATEFVQWLDTNDYENRGFYPALRGKGFDVRFRTY